jgi:sulfur dioxygenase
MNHVTGQRGARSLRCPVQPIEETMIFRQLFEPVSGTYSYVLASRRGGEALIIDPVLDKVDRYLRLMEELELNLVKAVDTHLHADHITGLGALRDRTQCITVMGEQSKVDVVSMRIGEGDKLRIEGVSLDVLYTPGHTDDSYSFTMGDRVFTGDTLLIRGTGRTDFQNGNASAQYESLQRLMRLPEETLVFPAHDYKGDTVSTIGEEKRFNPRLQVKDAGEYAALMAGLNLPNPKMMDVAVPANMRQGLLQAEIARRGWAVSAAEAQALLGCHDVALIDLRERAERDKHGVIPGSIHAPYPDLQENVRPGGVLHELAAGTGKRLLFYCAFGERSAMAVQAAQDAGLALARHIEGGMGAWKDAGGPSER